MTRTHFKKRGPLSFAYQNHFKMRYTNRPHSIIAVQITPETFDEACELAGAGKLSNGQPEARYIDEEGEALGARQTSKERGLIIPTPQGEVIARENDWIVRRADEELQVFSPEDFEKYYYPVQYI